MYQHYTTRKNKRGKIFKVIIIRIILKFIEAGVICPLNCPRKTKSMPIPLDFYQYAPLSNIAIVLFAVFPPFSGV